MSVAKTTVYNVQTDGDDLNGGGFNSASSGTNYSLQTSAQLSLSDCATSGSGVATLTSALGGFTSAMVGNIIQLSSGTNLTTGWYEITAYTDTNTVTLDRAPDDGVGGVSLAVGKVGGALASLKLLSRASDNDLNDGNTVFVKSGTYTVDSTSAGDGTHVYMRATNINSGLPFSNTFELAGYYQTQGDLDDTVGSANRPVFQLGSVTGSSYIFDLSLAYGLFIVWRHFVVDAGSKNGPRGFGIYHDIKLSNTAYHGFSGSGASMASCCEHAGSGQNGFDGALSIISCVANNCSIAGFALNGRAAINCIAVSCGIGFKMTGNGSRTINCTSYDSTTDGFNIASSGAALINCHSESNGAYGYKLIEQADPKACILVNCADFGNTSGRKQYSTNATYNTYDVNPVTLSASGITSATDFTPNDTAGGGALLRDKAMAFANGQATLEDIGAVQHTPSSGGGSSSVHPLYAN